jgi:predicted aspartyl protease
VNGQAVIRLVVFGNEGEEPLLGADTLEGLLLSVDPVKHRLVPTPGLLMLVTTPQLNLLGKRPGFRRGH